MAEKAKVVVVGGGFGGVFSTRKILRRVGLDAEVTLVSTSPDFMYTPLLPEAACGSLEARSILTPIRSVVPDAHMVLGTVTGVDASQQTIVVSQDTDSRTLHYDRLVLAAGGETRLFDIPGLSEHCTGARAMTDGVWIRDHAVSMLNRAAMETNPQTKRRLLTFVFIGGGLCGVEMIAELHRSVTASLVHYPTIAEADLSWILVDASPRILGELPDRLSTKVHRRLLRQGVRIATDTTVSHVSAQAVTLSNGLCIPSETVVWAAGLAPSPLMRQLGVDLDAGRVRVDAFLRVQDTDRIWALGDCARVPNPREHSGWSPPTAQHARRQADIAGNNVAASIGIGKWKHFSYRTRGTLASLGTGYGAAHIGPVQFQGKAAWMLTRLHHLIALPTLRTRMRVLADWMIQATIGHQLQGGPQVQRPRLHNRPEMKAGKHAA